MWRSFLYQLGWFPSIVALTLLVACSGPEPQGQSTGDRPNSVPVEDSSASKPTSEQTSTGSRESTAKPASGSITTSARDGKSAESDSSSPSEIANGDPSSSEPNRLTFGGTTFLTTQRMAGFSPNGNYYVYLESSRDTGAGVPSLSLQVINLDSNACVQDGCVQTDYSEPNANLSLATVERDLLKRTWKLRKDLNLTSPVSGDVVLVRSRSRTEDGSETITGSLPKTNTPLQLHLRQKRISDGKASSYRAAMQLEVLYNGQRRSLDSLDNFRDWVLDYSIREVKLSPQGDRIVILMTALKPTFEGTLATTVVQGFEL